MYTTGNRYNAYLYFLILRCSGRRILFGKHNRKCKRRNIRIHRYRLQQLSGIAHYTKVDTYEQAYTATTQATNETNNVSEVPCLFFTGLYPLSLHSAALYGKLLGEPFNILIDRIIPDGNTASKEVTKYTYSFDKRNIITSCKEIINSYGTDYIRTVHYVIE